MQLYALASSQLLRETLDIFLTREAAEAELLEILEGEPGWLDVLHVQPIQLDAQRTSRPRLVASPPQDPQRRERQ